MSTPHAAGQPLEILWRGKWYRGRIVRVVGEEQWEISYDAFDTRWNEVVGPDRLRMIGSGGLATSDEMPAPRVVWAYALFVVAGVLFVAMLLQPKDSTLTPGLFLGSLAVLVVGVALRPRRRKVADQGAASPDWDEKADLERRWKEESEFSTPENSVRAEILSAYQMGQYNLMPDIQFSLRIEHPDGPYDVTVTKAIEPTELHRFAKGSTIDVYVNPKNRNHVVIPTY
jgi:hypothetical protein